uniref:EF-hand domain-containing protein n=1 Tax=Otolemur garnettii TaxID=30611 RepID=H0XA43_OTOGA
MASEAEKTFQRFAVLGDSSSSGAEINNKNSSKLCQDCGITDGKTVTSADVDTVFNKVKAKDAGTITFQQFTEVWMALDPKSSGPTLKEEEEEEAGSSPFVGFHQAARAGAVDRLTNTSYTGSHAERLDDSGKGKGKDIAGREETTGNSGY